LSTIVEKTCVAWHPHSVAGYHYPIVKVHLLIPKYAVVGRVFYMMAYAGKTL
jgi:hypothetical protein